MIGSAIVLAGAISIASMPESALRRLQQDYPTWAVRDGKSAALTLELIVEADGKVRECTVVKFVGDERLAREVCQKYARARMRPATGPDGQPILSTYRTFTSMWVDGSRQKDAVQRAGPTPQIVVPVRELPEGKKFAFDAIELLIGADGRVKLCEPGAEYEEQEIEALIRAACDEAGNLPLEPFEDASLAPVEHVRAVSVRFEVNSPA